LSDGRAGAVAAGRRALPVDIDPDTRRVATLLPGGMPEKPTDGRPTTGRAAVVDSRRRWSEALVPTTPRRDDLRRRLSSWFPDRALALATQAFVALIPMLIVVAAAVPDRSRAALGGYVVDHLRLSGSAADDLHELVQRPPQSTEPVTFVGLVILVVSVLLVSWLIALGLLIVLAAVLSAESDGAAPQPEHAAPSPVGAP